MSPALRSPIADFEAWLRRRLDAMPRHPRLGTVVDDALLAGGKRFRAELVFTSGRLCGRPAGALYPAAAAVEMIHAYSLVHDDLPALDNAGLRRGRATQHRRYGEAMAILAGDALLTDAFAVLTDSPAAPDRIVEAVRSLALAAGSPGMVSGQVGDILDLEHTRDVERVREIHAGKTGALIRWSLDAPFALFAPGDATRRIVAEYAEHLGVLYQVRDDLLDLDPEAGRDKDRNADGSKSTYARLLGPSAARQSAEDELSACLAAAVHLPEPHAGAFAELARWTAGRTA